MASFDKDTIIFAIYDMSLRAMLGEEGRGLKITTKKYEPKDYVQFVTEYFEIAGRTEKEPASAASAATAATTATETVAIAFGPESVHTKSPDSLRKFLSALYNAHPQMEDLLLFTQASLSTHNSKLVTEFATEHKIYLEPLKTDRLLIAWGKHNPFYAPHSKVDEAEIKRALDERKITRDSFPHICKDDTGVLYAKGSPRPGDIVEVKTISETTCKKVSWYYVSTKSVYPPDMK